MKENKIFGKKSILLFLLIITLTFTLFKSYQKIPELNIKEKEKKKTRNLLDSEKVYNICKNSPKEVFDFYYNNSDFELSEKINYEDDKEYIQILISMLDEKKIDKEKIKKYIMHILPFICFLIITFLVPIFWIGCLCCCCCNWLCCCCCCQNNCCKNMCYLMTIIFLLLGMIFALLGLNRYEEVFTSLNGASCSLMKLVLELSEGQKKDSLPRWDGIDKIKDILSDAISSIKNSKGEISSDFESQMNELNNKINSWHDLLTQSYNDVKDSYLDNILEDNTNYYPSYIKSYGPYSEERTILYGSDQEFSTILTYFKNAQDNIKIVVNDDTVTNNLEDAKNQLDDLLSQFNDITDSIVDPWYDYQDKGVKYGKKGSKLFFYFILIENFLLMIFFTTIICMNLGCLFKLIIHLLWIILGILILVIMLLGSILTLLGAVGKDVVSVLHFVVSSENLNSEIPKIFSSGDSLKYINTCLNGDGDLSSAFNFDDATDSLNEIVLLRNSLINSFNDIKYLNESYSLSEYEKQILNKYQEEYLSDIYFSDKEKIGDLDYSLKLNLKIKDLNDLTNSENQKEGEKDCKRINDLYSLSNSHSGYTLISPLKPTQNIGSNSLIYLYNDWTQTLIEERYENVCPGKNNENIKADASNYIKLFNNIKTENTKIISNIKTKNLKINEEFKNVISIMRKTLESCSKIIEPIFEIFNNIIGDSNNIFSILNCGFLASNIEVTFTEIYNGLGKDIHDYGKLIFGIGVLEGFSIWGILIGMNLHKILQDKKKDQESKITQFNPVSNMDKDGLKMGKINNDKQGNDSNLKLVLNDNK